MTNADEVMAAVMFQPAAPARSLLEEFDRSAVLGAIWTREVLSRRDRRLITLSCVSFDQVESDIDAHVYAALASGDLTPQELGEFVLHFAVYCGWPKASTVEMAVRAQWARVCMERGERPAPWPELQVEDLGPADPAERIREGEESWVAVNAIPPPPHDSPYFYAGILNFVFGHVWNRPGMNRRDRRLVTLACVGMCDAMGPIRSHVGSALQTGDVNAEEMPELILHFSAYGGRHRADVLDRVATEELGRLEQAPQ